MKRPRLEVAEVFRSCQDEYFQTHSASAEQRRVFRDIVVCRTAGLGGHVKRCDQCGHEEIAYNSCRNRHCPKCQAKRQADWCEERSRDLLDVPYFHIVFTLPDELGPLALQNQRILYNLLFRAAAETLLTLARDERHLGAHIGFLAVLHTWGQTLLHHPHLHCVVPAGGLSADHTRWISSRKNFFLPVRVLSCLFQKINPLTDDGLDRTQDELPRRKMTRSKSSPHHRFSLSLVLSATARYSSIQSLPALSHQPSPNPSPPFSKPPFTALDTPANNLISPLSTQFLPHTPIQYP